MKFQRFIGGDGGIYTDAPHPPACASPFGRLAPLAIRQSTGLSQFTLAPVRVRIPSHQMRKEAKGLFRIWRRRWDSNPRALADNRISSAARYDHFDTSPDISEQVIVYPKSEDFATEDFRTSFRPRNSVILILPSYACPIFSNFLVAVR